MSLTVWHHPMLFISHHRPHIIFIGILYINQYFCLLCIILIILYPTTSVTEIKKKYKNNTKGKKIVHYIQYTYIHISIY